MKLAAESEMEVEAEVGVEVEVETAAETSTDVENEIDAGESQADGVDWSADEVLNGFAQYAEYQHYE